LRRARVPLAPGSQAIGYPEIKMLAGKRAERVGNQILKEISFLLHGRVKDPRVKGITVTGIRLSNDLRVARIYFSLIGDDRELERARAGLDSARGFIKREIGLRMDLKYVPEIVFEHDPSLEIGNQMERLFEEMRSPEKGNVE
jgi:ribosome-binding factor A